MAKQENKITEESVNLVRQQYEGSLKQLLAKRDVDLTNCRDAISVLTDVIIQTTLTKEILQLKLDTANKLHQDYFVPSSSSVQIDHHLEGPGLQSPYMYAQLTRDVPVGDAATETLLYETLGYGGPLQLMPLRCGEWVRVWKVEGKDNQIWTCEWLTTADGREKQLRSTNPTAATNSTHTPAKTNSRPITSRAISFTSFWDRKHSPSSTSSTANYSPTFRRTPASGPIAVTPRTQSEKFLNLDDVHSIEDSSPRGSEDTNEEDYLRHEASNSSLFIVLAEWCKVHKHLGDLHCRLDKAIAAQRKQVLTLLKQQQAAHYDGGGADHHHENDDHVCQPTCSHPCEVRRRQDEKERFLLEDKSFRYKQQAITQLFKEFGHFDFQLFKELVLARMSLKKQIDELGTESGDGGQLKELWDKRTVWNLRLKEAEDRWQLKEEELKRLRDRAVAARERTLIAACERCDFEQVQEIMRQAKRKTELVNELDHDNGPLHVACLRGDVKIAHFLLNSRADPMLVDISKGDTPLHYAARNGNVALMELLLEYYFRKEGTDSRHFINVQGRKKRTPLDTAAHFANKDAVRWLLSKGATTSVTDDETQRTPLHSAARHGSMAVTKLLVNAGGDPFARNKFGQTPLFMAVFHGHLQLAKFYVDQGAWLTKEEKQTLIEEKNKKVAFVLTTVLNEQLAALRGETVANDKAAEAPE